MTVEYAAGFMDGEGCITIKRVKKERLKRSKHDCYQIIVCVTNSEIAPLVELRDCWGGTIRRLKRYAPHHRWRYFWLLSAKGAMVFLEAIYPHLIIKKEVAMLCMEMQQTNLQAQFRNGVEITPELHAWREQQLAKVRHLNRRGIRTTDPVI